MMALRNYTGPVSLLQIDSKLSIIWFNLTSYLRFICKISLNYEVMQFHSSERTVPVNSVFLSSTDYDFIDFRHHLSQLLKQEMFNVETFKNQPVDPFPDSHSHDLCLDMVSSSDSLVCIIGTRGGGKYVGEKYKSLFKAIKGCPKDLSITGAEVLLAFEQRKPVIILVKEKVWNMRKTGSSDLDPSVRALLNYLQLRTRGNWMYTDIHTADDAFAKILTSGLTPMRRLALLGDAMAGDGWNGRELFSDREVTIVNKLRDNYTSLLSLNLIEDIHGDEEDRRLRWLIDLLSPKELTSEQKEFLYKYIKTNISSRITGFSDLEGRDLARMESKAVHLLRQLRFGDDRLFGSYEHSVRGKKPILLQWPQDSKEWSAPGRLEFMLYSMRLEKKLPINLIHMCDFSSANIGSTGYGFEAHYSRKPVTVGCESACKVRLVAHGKRRGIHLEQEMKSMLYLVKHGKTFSLVAVHCKGDQEIDLSKVLVEVCSALGINNSALRKIQDNDVLSYLEEIESAHPIEETKHFIDKKITPFGAQELIGLYASSINPVLILKNVAFKLNFIEKHCGEGYFDVVMLWDQGVVDLDECYNNAGSPSWGIRFHPMLMYNHVKANAERFVAQFDNRVKFAVRIGDFCQ